MHQISLNQRMPDVDQVCNIMRTHNARMGICFDYDKICEYFSYYTMTGKRIRDNLQKYLRFGLDSKMTGNDFLKIMAKFGVKEGFLPTQGGGISLKAESIQNAIDSGLYSEDICTILKAYSKMSHSEYIVSSLNAYMRYEPVNCPTFDGHRMIVVHPDWVPQNTGRYAMQNPAVQNIAKEIGDIVTVPKGWVFYECDSSQIEPRIIYSAFIPDPQIQTLIKLYNDAYFGLLHYVTMPIELITKGVMDFEKHEITDDMKDKRQFLKRLGNGVMYGKQSNPSGDQLIENYIQRIGGHPMRVRWQKEAEEAVDRGQKVFNTVFGTPIDITVGDGGDKYADSGANAVRNHLVRCAINNPIQGTAGDLNRYSIMACDHFLTRNCPNSVILYSSHDSDKFAIHEDEYDKAMSFLKDATSYQVEGWIPIYSEGSEGRHGGAFADII